MSTSNENNDAMISIGKHRWWCRPLAVDGLAVPKIGVLLTLMGSTPRPTNPEESLFNGFVRNSRFHDREPGLLLAALLGLDPQFFAEYPTRAGRPLDHKGMKSEIGAAACAFLRWGPGFRQRAGAENGEETGRAAVTQAEPEPEAVVQPRAVIQPEAEAVIQPEARPEPEPEPEPTPESVHEPVHEPVPALSV